MVARYLDVGTVGFRVVDKYVFHSATVNGLRPVLIAALMARTDARQFRGYCHSNFPTIRPVKNTMPNIVR